MRSSVNGIAPTELSMLFGVSEELCNYARAIIKETITKKQNEFRNWLLSKYQCKNGKNWLSYAVKYHEYAFNSELAALPNTRKKIDIMLSISALTRFIKVQQGINLHKLWLTWLSEKEIHWVKTQPKIQTEAKDVSLEKIPEDYHEYVLFMYTTGLRTGEAIQVFNEHNIWCKNGVLELYWNRGNRKYANATYCLCNIIPYENWHTKQLTTDKIKKNVNTKALGFEPRYLRHLNFTVNANKVNPLLAEFMQGRRGSISEKHYYISLLGEYRQKWLETWQPIIAQLKQTCAVTL